MSAKYFWKKYPPYQCVKNRSKRGGSCIDITTFFGTIEYKKNVFSCGSKYFPYLMRKMELRINFAKAEQVPLKIVHL